MAVAKVGAGAEIMAKAGVGAKNKSFRLRNTDSNICLVFIGRGGGGVEEGSSVSLIAWNYSERAQFNSTY